MYRYYLLLGAFAAAVATAVSVVILADPSPAPADPFEGLHLSAPEYDALQDDEVLNSPTVSYQSETFSYKISYPGTWELDDSRTDFHGDILSDPDERAVVTITETKDVSVMTPQGIDRTARSIEEALRYDSEFDLERFERLMWKRWPAVFTDGVRIIGGKRYHTREYNIFRPEHGGILNVSITTQEDAEPLYEKALKDILRSLDVCPEE